MSSKPRAFRLDSADVATVPADADPPPHARVVVARQPDDIIDDPQPPAGETPPKRRAPWAAMLLSALGGLAVFGVGLWIDSLARRLFEINPGLGWAALALAGLAGAGLAGLLAREALGVMRERRIERLRKQAETAWRDDSDRDARAILRELDALYARRPDTARARAALAAIGSEIIDARDRLAIAERELMAPLDRRARQAVARAARQVSLVTAISPRALVDVAFVLYASFALVRRIASVYGGRPGVFGFLRLARNVAAHLAVTGGVAAGDGLVQQAMGLGLAARVSARLGEGVVNGMLTARVGLAAIDVCRPMPFHALPAPSFTEVAGHLFERAATKDGA
ncbi:YcjF family protein [Camelimonas abortus]|uniref:YcjF family protein n=1 Tax=Camelimonas abortus TaxID=1017184 RepID=A0ABV7LBN6_9HYPH